MVMTLVQLIVSLIGVALISENKDPQTDKSLKISQDQKSQEQKLNQTESPKNVIYLLINSDLKSKPEMSKHLFCLPILHHSM